MKNMRVVTRIKTLRRLVGQVRRRGKKIGLVPTMGYLHEGHLSLIRLAFKHTDFVVVTIFVNPTQFGPKEDLKRYPRDIKHDLSLLKKENADMVFYPAAKEIYPSNYSTCVEVEDLSKILCGASRPTHFRGVTTIVLKLLNIVKADVALFGQKDYQQALIIKKMVKDLNVDTRVVIGKTIRERDGLAMSSRNTYLTTGQRKNAVVIYRALKQIKQHHRKFKSSKSALAWARRKITMAGGRVDYIKTVDKNTLAEVRSLKRGTAILAAVFFGKTRLIDNIII